MAITQALCTSFKSEILDEQHDITSDTIKCAHLPNHIGLTRFLA